MDTPVDLDNWPTAAPPQPTAPGFRGAEVSPAEARQLALRRVLDRAAEAGSEPAAVHHYLAGQALFLAAEARTTPTTAVRELLGAINYLAGAVIALEK